MQAIPNKIVIGDESSPILTIENDKIESVSEETAVSLIGDELFIDQFFPVIKYTVYIKYLFVPTNYDRFITKDGKILCGHYNYDLRGLPYGTKITFYSNNRVAGVFYSENVERTGKEQYKINAISAIGLMNRQRSKGGIYTGQPFEAVLREIVGDEYEYTINGDVAKLQVYGWLPHSTRRRNLHQLIMAYGVNIVRSDDGGMLFTFLVNSTPQEIPESRVYHGGKVTYNEPASRVEVVEHAYHYLESVEEETLFDNTTSDVVTNALITFDKPIYASSLRASSEKLTILSRGVNYAVISGVGVLTGKPYVHTTRVVSADNPHAAKEKVVRVEEATLVTLTNSENVLLRVAEYYFNATTVENSIVVDTEKCGRRYAMLNAFYEYTSGFMSKMSAAVSSVKKATCEFIANYIPRGQGATYTEKVILTAASGTWKVPPEVFDKAAPNIRVVLIGGGETGGAGKPGANGSEAKTTDGTETIPATGTPGKGGAGGVGGNGGNGGQVYSTTLNCTGITSFTYGRSGLNTFFKGGIHELNSADGASSATGFLEIFSGTVYALPGHAGQPGAAGGVGGVYKPSKYSGSTYPESGGNVTYNGKTYKGGAAGSRKTVALSNGTNTLYYGGGGGGGAAVGANGSAAADDGWQSNGGNGAAGAKGDAITTKDSFGLGGNGGHGGGGGGGGGVTANYNFANSHWVASVSGAGGTGGAGGAGGAGYQGCVIIYY